MTAPKCCCPSRDAGECISIRYPIRDSQEDEREECECACHAECLFEDGTVDKTEQCGCYDCQWEDQP